MKWHKCSVPNEYRLAQSGCFPMLWDTWWIKQTCYEFLLSQNQHVVMEKGSFFSEFRCCMDIPDNFLQPWVWLFIITIRIVIKQKHPTINIVGCLFSCGGRTRTCDLQVMSLASYQLLHSAMCYFSLQCHCWIASAKLLFFIGICKLFGCFLCIYWRYFCGNTKNIRHILIAVDRA